MNGYLRQSTASQARLIGPFLDDTDFKTAETALTINASDILLRANGTTLSAKNSGGGTHQANGMYSVSWDATDTANVGELFFSVKVAGALQVFGSYCVVEEEVYDDLFASSAVGYLKPTTAGRDLDVSAGGEAGVDWANVGSPTTAVGLTNTTISTSQTIASVANISAQTGDSFARLGAPAGASIAADIAGISAASAGRIVDAQGGAFYKQSTAFTKVFIMRSSSDHATVKTGAAPIVTLSKAGGAFAAAGGTVTEIGSGYYQIVLTTTDTNTTGDLAFHITGTGADTVDFVDQVFPTVVFR